MLDTGNIDRDNVNYNERLDQRHFDSDFVFCPAMFSGASC